MDLVDRSTPTAGCYTTAADHLLSNELCSAERLTPPNLSEPDGSQPSLRDTGTAHEDEAVGIEQDFPQLTLKSRTVAREISWGSLHSAYPSIQGDQTISSPVGSSDQSYLFAHEGECQNREQRRRKAKSASKQVRRAEAEQRARETVIKKAKLRHILRGVPFERRGDLFRRDFDEDHPKQKITHSQQSCEGSCGSQQKAVSAQPSNSVHLTERNEDDYTQPTRNPLTSPNRKSPEFTEHIEPLLHPSLSADKLRTEAASLYNALKELQPDTSAYQNITDEIKGPEECLHHQSRVTSPEDEAPEYTEEDQRAVCAAGQHHDNFPPSQISTQNYEPSENPESKIVSATRPKDSGTNESRSRKEKKKKKKQKRKTPAVKAKQQPVQLDVADQSSNRPDDNRIAQINGAKKSMLGGQEEACTEAQDLSSPLPHVLQRRENTMTSFPSLIRQSSASIFNPQSLQIVDEEVKITGEVDPDEGPQKEATLNGTYLAQIGNKSTSSRITHLGDTSEEENNSDGSRSQGNQELHLQRKAHAPSEKCTPRIERKLPLEERCSSWQKCTTEGKSISLEPIDTATNAGYSDSVFVFGQSMSQSHDFAFKSTSMLSQKADFEERRAGGMEMLSPLLDSPPPLEMPAAWNASSTLDNVNGSSSSVFSSPTSPREMHIPEGAASTIAANGSTAVEDDHAWIRTTTSSPQYVSTSGIVFGPEFSLYGHHALRLAIEKYHFSVVDHFENNNVEDARGAETLLILEGGFVVKPVDFWGTVEVIGYFPEGTPLHIPLTPLLKEEAEARAAHDLQQQPLLSQLGNCEVDHGYSASEGSLSEDEKDAGVDSQESLPRRHCQNYERRLGFGGHFAEERDWGRFSSSSYEEYMCAEEDRAQEVSEGLEPDRTGDVVEAEGPEGRGDEIEDRRLRAGTEQGRSLEQHRYMDHDYSYQLPANLQQLKARLAAKGICSFGRSAQGDRGSDDQGCSTLMIGDHHHHRLSNINLSQSKHWIPSSRPTRRTSSTYPAMDDMAVSSKTPLPPISEEAPIRKYGGTALASLPRPKVARSLLSRQLGARVRPTLRVTTHLREQSRSRLPTVPLPDGLNGTSGDWDPEMHQRIGVPRVSTVEHTVAMEVLQDALRCSLGESQGQEHPPSYDEDLFGNGESSIQTGRLVEVDSDGAEMFQEDINEGPLVLGSQASERARAGKQ